MKMVESSSTNVMPAALRARRVFGLRVGGWKFKT